MILIGACAGFFVVPMNALLQHRGHVLMGAGHSIAVQNFNENIGILVMVGLYALMIRRACRSTRRSCCSGCSCRARWRWCCCATGEPGAGRFAAPHRPRQGTSAPGGAARGGSQPGCQRPSARRRSRATARSRSIRQFVRAGAAVARKMPLEQRVDRCDPALDARGITAVAKRRLHRPAHRFPRLLADPRSMPRSATISTSRSASSR